MNTKRDKRTLLWAFTLIFCALVTSVSRAESCSRSSIQKIREIKSTVARAIKKSDFRLDHEAEKTSPQEEYSRVQPIRERSLAELREVLRACSTTAVVLQAYELYYDNDLGISYYVDDFVQEFADILGPDSDLVLRKYVIGDRWNGEVLLPAQLEEAGLKKLAMSVFQTDGTVSFYGKIGGEYVFATNHHVISGNTKCNGQMLTSPFFRAKLECNEVLAADMGTDFSLFTVKQDTEGAMEILDQIAAGYLRFDFTKTAEKDTPALFIGYGSYRRSSMNKAAGWFSDWDRMLPMVKRSEECRVLSSDVRQIDQDPDLVNPATVYSVPTQPLGCEFTHGDSGSSLLNRRTRRVMGLVATLATPYPYRSNEEMRTISGAAVWEYSLMIPSMAIAEFLKKEAEATKKPLAKKVILELLARDSQ